MEGIYSKIHWVLCAWAQSIDFKTLCIYLKVRETTIACWLHFEHVIPCGSWEKYDPCSRKAETIRYLRRSVGQTGLFNDGEINLGFVCGLARTQDNVDKTWVWKRKMWIKVQVHTQLSCNEWKQSPRHKENLPDWKFQPGKKCNVFRSAMNHLFKRSEFFSLDLVYQC